MGVSPSSGPMRETTIRRMFNPADCFQASREGKASLQHGEEVPGVDALAAYCILGGQVARFDAGAAALLRVRQPLMKATSKTRRSSKCSKPDANCAELRALDRSLGCVLGNAVGD